MHLESGSTRTRVTFRQLIAPPHTYKYKQGPVGFRLPLGSMDTELTRANPHSYPSDLLQGFQEFFCRPNPEDTNIALVLERRPLAQHEARPREVVHLDRGRHDLAIQLVLQHRR